MNNGMNDKKTEQANNKKAVICGCARDIAEYLPKSIEKIVEIGGYFSEYKIVIYENDSKDNTLEILKSYKEKLPIHIITETGIDTKYKVRAHRIGYCRNKIIEYINSSLLDTFKPDYYINIDLDNICIDLDTSSIPELLEDNSWWDAVFANTNHKPGEYYDFWALRTEKNQENFWSRYYKREYKLSNFFNKVAHIKYFPKSEGPYKVLSAFSGFGIYKIDKIKDCKYDGRWKNKKGLRDIPQDCEHVAFHRDMREKNNARLFLIPKLANF